MATTFKLSTKVGAGRQCGLHESGWDAADQSGHIESGTSHRLRVLGWCSIRLRLLNAFPPRYVGHIYDQYRNFYVNQAQGACEQDEKMRPIFHWLHVQIWLVSGSFSKLNEITKHSKIQVTAQP